jgi:hypothetical protein
MDPGRPRALDRGDRPRAQHEVGRDERSVEVARERGDVLREVGRELYWPGTWPPVALTT